MRGGEKEVQNREQNVSHGGLHAFARFGRSDETIDPRRSHALTDDGRVPLAEFLTGHDIIVNCVLQDTAAPLTFLIEDDLPTLAPGTLIVDVSCDEGMGFSWARSTTFARPTFVVGDQVTYYAVSQDHVPGGVRNCTSSLNCLNVSSELGTPLTNRYAILALAGRSVTGTTGANRVIGDFLDTTENTNFNSVFEQKRFSKTFNDRFVNVSP